MTLPVTRLSFLVVGFLALAMPPAPVVTYLVSPPPSFDLMYKHPGVVGPLVRAISSGKRSSGVAIAVSPAARKNQYIDRTWKNRKTACEKGECAHLDVDADAGNNCVFNCTHPACYELVYAADPLEPGEVDEKRYNSFVACIRKDLRSSNSKESPGRGTEY